MSGRRVEAVDRALTVLDAFLPGDGALALKDLAARTGLHKSTILRLCGSLEAYGYLSRDPRGGRFRLGAKPCLLGSIYQRTFHLADHVRPVLASMVARSGETATFYVRDGAHRVCLFRENSPAGVRHHVDEGVRLPLDRGSAGTVLRAFDDDADPADRALAAVRRRGHAVSVGERDPDAAAVSAPVFDADGRCIGALSVSGLRTRLGPEKRRALARLVVEEAGALGRRLGARERPATPPRTRTRGTDA